MNEFEVNAFQVPNALVDKLIAELSGNELKCYLIIARKTKGWQKSEDAISISQFMELTGLSNRVIIQCCKNLEKMGLIESKKGYRNTSVYMCKKITSDEKSHVTKSHKSKNEEPIKSTVSATCDEKSLVTKSHTHKYNKKQYINNKKINKKDLDLSEFTQQPSEQVWNDYLQHRKNKKAKLTQTALNLLIKQINLCVKNGFTTDDVLSECMLRGWQGFKAEWLLKQKSEPFYSFSSVQTQSDGSWIENLEEEFF